MRIIDLGNEKKKSREVERKVIEYYMPQCFNYSLLFDNLDQGICIVNETGNIDYANSVYHKVFYGNELSIVGKNIFKLKSDSLIINAFRNKKNIKGSFINRFQGITIEAYAWSLYDDNQFKGVAAFYIVNKEKMDKEKFTDDRTMEQQEELRGPFGDILGESRNFKKALFAAQKASKTSSTVLIQGESGTGKELVSRAIHYHSNRSKGPFVVVNCGAMPDSLLESELFGYERGAFTGAIRQKLGKFEVAHTGTIFLDEIGELPLTMQVKLLRVLQEREFERIGGNRVIRTDVRIIAATHRNFKDMIREGSFREDLYYRLNVIPIHLPSLRERREDIPLLIKHFNTKISTDMGRVPLHFTQEAMDAMTSYDWPGNIRELENVIERAIALADKNTIEIYDLPSNITSIYEIRGPREEKTQLINMHSNGRLATFEEYEREIIKSAISKFGSFNAAGKALGINHKTVAFKARKYHIVD